MRKITRLTESQLNKIVERVLTEQDIKNEYPESPNKRMTNLISMIRSLKMENRPTLVIKNAQSGNNNMTWEEYVRKFEIDENEVSLAVRQAIKMGIQTPDFQDLVQIFDHGTHKPKYR